METGIDRMCQSGMAGFVRGFAMMLLYRLDPRLRGDDSVMLLIDSCRSNAAVPHRLRWVFE